MFDRLVLRKLQKHDVLLQVFIRQRRTQRPTVQRHKDTKTQRNKDTKTQRNKDTKTQRNKDSTIQRHKETKTHYNMYNMYMINTQHCLNVHRSNTIAAKSFSHHEQFSLIIFPVKDGNIKSICQSIHG